MRMKYTKPMLYAERFELTEHISACAGTMPNSAMFADPDTTASCGFALNGRGAEGPILFYENVSGSVCTDPGDAGLGGVCYNNFFPDGTPLYGS